MDKKNEKLVPIANSADYPQVTGTFSITHSGIFLPMQIIYRGQTDRCQLSSNFQRSSILHTVSITGLTKRKRSS